MFCRVFISVLILLCSSNSYSEQSERSDREFPVEFEMIVDRYVHGVDKTKYNSVNEIQSSAEWSRIWSEINSFASPEPDIPVVNFDEWFVLVVFDKLHSGTCHNFDVKTVYMNKSYPNHHAGVSIEYSIPGAGKGCLAARLEKFQIIKVKRL